nr:MAG TPA: hypothetical protein [Caudoviricetes sp.]
MPKDSKPHRPVPFIVGANIVRLRLLSQPTAASSSRRGANLASSLRGGARRAEEFRANHVRPIRPYEIISTELLHHRPALRIL